jgi:hypothetical protein
MTGGIKSAMVTRDTMGRRKSLPRWTAPPLKPRRITIENVFHQLAIILTEGANGAND